jgi:AraC-like DNA-binding protein
MLIDMAYLGLLLIGLTLMLAQLSLKQKRLEHIFFAIFSGSMAMVALKFLSADLVGVYKYVIGLGTCATCNAIWLTSRAMFRGQESIRPVHIGVAILIALFVMANQALQMAGELNLVAPQLHLMFDNGLGEVTQLLSSTILVLTVWEALRSAKAQAKTMRWPHYLFATAFVIGLVLCTICINVFVAPENKATVFPWFVVVSATQILIVTQIVLYSQLRQRQHLKSQEDLSQTASNEDAVEIEAHVSKGIQALMEDDKLYLQHNLKMGDLANRLGVSEYKISRAVRYQFEAPNFNHFINRYRVEHAKGLLTQNQSAHWSLLVIGLESGFSSITSFNRVFKLHVGVSPNEYRQTCRIRDRGDSVSLQTS